MRTKLDPRVEDWVARGRKADIVSPPFNPGTTGMGTGMIESKNNGDGGGLSESDLAALWEWAPVEANSEARRRNWGGNFTLEERERGVQDVAAELGLRRVLEDDEESEEEEEDEMDLGGFGKSEDAGGDNAAAATGDQVPTSPLVPMDEILRYMTTGILPALR